jgi:hypothetical protein
MGLEVPPLGSVKDRVLRRALQKKKQLLVLTLKYMSFLGILNKELDDKQLDATLSATNELIREIFNINNSRAFEVALDPDKKETFDQEDKQISKRQKKKTVPKELEQTFAFVKSLSEGYDQFDGDLKNLARAKKQYQVQHGTKPVNPSIAGKSFFSPKKSPDLWNKIKKGK